MRRTLKSRVAAYLSRFGARTGAELAKALKAPGGSVRRILVELRAQAARTQAPARGEAWRKALPPTRPMQGGRRRTAPPAPAPAPAPSPSPSTEELVINAFEKLAKGEAILARDLAERAGVDQAEVARILEDRASDLGAILDYGGAGGGGGGPWIVHGTPEADYDPGDAYEDVEL